ncbi:hypothetical protein B0J13DRAFT_631019 [Dactylonectria estremocensis]|uniref:Uncharacterized protein n=1 Tax=Dactylonectria estremocensis TaxID=1079267 RepID=A0A9P9D764_9HYPO|nr:hypothetical protein B0J13DRAFT_631019 [Dactylonectria estremocensis]
MIDIINLCNEMPKFPTKADGATLLPQGRPLPCCDKSALPPHASKFNHFYRSPGHDLSRSPTAKGHPQDADETRTLPHRSDSGVVRDIFFVRNETSPSRIRVDQPYISRHFEDKDEDNAQDGYNDIPMPTVRVDHNDRTLASLGIMLLELCFGTALEEHETRRRYCRHMPPGEAGEATTDPYLDMAAALEWHPHAAEEAGPEFSDTIEWCLKNMPNGSESGIRLDQWRGELLNKVVLPLKYCHDQFTVMRS